MADKIGAFALPGADAGSTAPAFLGGSNLAISAKSEHPDLALDLLKIMAGKGYQTQFARLGHHPGAEVAAGRGRRRRGREGPGRGRGEQPVRARPARTGPASRPPRSCPTCWSPSPRAATCKPRPPRPTTRSPPSSTAEPAAEAGADEVIGHGDRHGRTHRPRTIRPRCGRSLDRLATVTRTRRTGAARAVDGAGDARHPPPTRCSPRGGCTRRDARATRWCGWCVLSLQEFGLRQQFGAAARVGRARQLPPHPGRRLLLGRPVAHGHLRPRQRRCSPWASACSSPCCCGRSGRRMRLLVSVGLMLAWAMPALTATVVWQWLFDTQYGARQLAPHHARHRRLPGPLLAERARSASSSWPRSSSCGWASRSWRSRSTPA